MREVPFVPEADDLALATSHLAHPPPLRASPPHKPGSQPVGRVAGTVGGLLALRDDAFKTPTRRFDTRQVGALPRSGAPPSMRTKSCAGRSRRTSRSSSRPSSI